MLLHPPGDFGSRSILKGQKVHGFQRQKPPVLLWDILVRGSSGSNQLSMLWIKPRTL